MGHEIARHWRLRKQRYNLVGEKCENDHYIFPPRDICPDCHGEAKIPFQFSGKGKIYSFTTVYESPTDFEGNVPYQVALIKLDEGPMITAQLTDFGDEPVEIGVPVEMVTRKLKDDSDKRGVIIYGYKFRPVFSSK